MSTRSNISTKSKGSLYERIQPHTRGYCPFKSSAHTRLLNNSNVKNEIIHPLFMGIYNLDFSKLEAELFPLSTSEVNNISYAGQHPLHAVCHVKSLFMLKSLLEKGAKVNLVNIVGNTPLHIAVTESWKEGVEELLKQGANPNALTEENSKVKIPVYQTPLHIAVQKGNVDIVNLLLDYNPDLNTKDSEGNCLLHLAAHSHSVQLLTILLDKKECKSYFEAGNNRGNTPFHSLMNTDETLIELEQEIIKCVQMFIDEGTDVNCLNLLGESPLYLACRLNLPIVVEYLLTLEVDPTVLTKEEESTLHASCKSGSWASLRHLIYTGKVCDLILQDDSKGESPFHKAIASSSIDCCEILLNNGDFLTNKDSRGRTRCSLILLNLPNAFNLLNRVFDSKTKVSNTYIYDPTLSVAFDYSVLFNSRSSCVQNSIISELTVGRFEKLLIHPLIESFLYIKWGRIKTFFYLGVFNYFLFLLLHTIFLLKTYGGVNCVDWSLPENQHELLIFRVLYIVLFIVIIVPDLILLASQFKKYIRHVETHTKLVTFTTSIVIICSCDSDINILFQRNVASVSILFGWFELMILLGRLPMFGTYILMFITISKSIIKFLIAFSFILVGYACAFGIIFYDVYTFKTLPLTVLKTIMMMIGEIEYGDIYNQGNLTRLFKGGNESYHVYTNDFFRLLILTTFIFLVPVLMANLLIGLAVNDIPDLRRQGKIQRLAKQASYIVSYEKLMFFFKRHSWFPYFIRKLLSNHYKICGEVTYYPNKKVHTVKRHLRIPSETLQEAIIVGAKNENIEDLHILKDDFETQFYNFRKCYMKNWKSLESKISTLVNKNEQKCNCHTDFPQVLANIDNKLEDQKYLLQQILSQQTPAQ